MEQPGYITNAKYKNGVKDVTKNNNMSGLSKSKTFKNIDPVVLQLYHTG